MPSTRQRATNQLVLNLARIVNLHIFQGAGLDRTGLEEAWQHTSVNRAVSMYNGSSECYIWRIKIIFWLPPSALMLLFDGYNSATSVYQDAARIYSHETILSTTMGLKLRFHS